MEMERVIGEIRKDKPRLTCIQLPEGLKPRAMEISKQIEDETDTKVLIWAGTCFGACDTPDLDKLGVDLLIQWGHEAWN